jgi:hypothetical protein
MLPPVFPEPAWPKLLPDGSASLLGGMLGLADGPDGLLLRPASRAPVFTLLFMFSLSWFAICFCSLLQFFAEVLLWNAVQAFPVTPLRCRFILDMQVPYRCRNRLFLLNLAR